MNEMTHQQNINQTAQNIQPSMPINQNTVRTMQNVPVNQNQVNQVPQNIPANHNNSTATPQNIPASTQTITMPQTIQNSQNIANQPEIITFQPLDPTTFPIINNYCENLTTKNYVSNPAIAREEEIKKTMLVLLTPDKSALLIGKAGIGKTAIVEGIAYKIQRNDVPDALKGYQILKINSSSMLGKMIKDGKEESVTNLLVNELKKAPKTILFIDEVHTLIGGSQDGPMDLANVLKPALDRGDIKAIGATTTIEYETYIVRDRAFLRRFDRIEVLEPDHDATVKILLGTIPKIEFKTGIKMIPNQYITEELMHSIVSATSEYKRVYGLSAMYPDVSLSVLSGAFSNALFENRKIVGILDVYVAIRDSKRIYPDSRVKECAAFKEKFKQICQQENIILPDVKIEDIDTSSDL